MSLAGGCRRFQPNVFNSARCQNCYKVKETHHSTNAVFNCANKMGRKVIACSFLYVAPTNLDFSLPSHSNKRWQRRWFSLHDDGGLEVRIDNNPETVPQLKMDMKRCIRVCIADAITNHPHSLLIAFNNNQYAEDENFCHGITKSNELNECCGHPVICYVKSDTSEEIRCWQNVLQVFARNLVHVIPRQSSSLLIEQTDPSQPGSRSESAMSSSSSIEQKQALNDASFLAETDEFIEVEPDTSYLMPPNELTADEVKLEDSQQSRPSTDFQLPIKSAMTVPFQIDTSNLHTLRKGWLMLRGKSENEWQKHWVVLAGLNIKLYNDVWIDDSAEPILTIDLSECENVYPSAATKNYGIEIKCKRARYILSAMTPGIRDSWIQALQQNLHNPSPTYSEMASMDALSQTDSADILSITRRKKHIAYVAPESYHSNSIMDGFSSSTEADDDARTGDSSIRPTVDIPDANIILPAIGGAYADSASVNSSADERSASRTALNQRRRSTATNRQLSLSPSMRRSPVNRLKERRRIVDRNAQRVAELSQPISPSHAHSRRTQFNRHQADNSERQQFELTTSSLQQQVQELRDQLSEAKNRLSEVANENDRLRTLFSNQDIEHLRRCLHAAEENVNRQQKEMDVLQKQFDSPTATTSTGSTVQLQASSNQNLNIFPLEISQRLVALLKIQIGALSKVLHSSRATSFISLRHYVDNLIRTVAGLDENSPQNVDVMQHSFNNVIAAFESLSSILKSTGIDSSTKTDAENLNATNLKLLQEIKELEREIEQIQSAYGREVQRQKEEFERQLQTLRERIESEESAKKKLQEELQNIHNAGSSQEQHLNAMHESAISELRQQFEEHLQKLQQEHDQELDEEKQATKLALDVVQRAHTEELQKLKSNNPIKKDCRCQTEPSIMPPVRESPRQREVVDLISSELSNLSTLYSAKCLENSQLDEKLKNVLMQNEKEKSELELENSRLRRDLQQKDDSYMQLRKRLDYLEQKLKDTNQTRAALPCNFPPTAKRSESLASDASVRFRVPANGAASRKVSSNRRNDPRYHSNPLIPYSKEQHAADVTFNAYYERHFDTDKKICCVAERRKIFEMNA